MSTSAEDTSALPAQAVSRTRLAIARVGHALPGAGLSAVIALAATFVSTLHRGPQLLYALFFGVAFHYLSHEPKTKSCIEMKTSFMQLARAGWRPFTLILIETLWLAGLVLGCALSLR